MKPYTRQDGYAVAQYCADGIAVHSRVQCLSASTNIELMSIAVGSCALRPLSDSPANCHLPVYCHLSLMLATESMLLASCNTFDNA